MTNGALSRKKPNSAYNYNNVCEYTKYDAKRAAVTLLFARVVIFVNANAYCKAVKPSFFKTIWWIVRMIKVQSHPILPRRKE